MISEVVLSGWLRDFSLMELLQVVEMGSMTGAIHLDRGLGIAAILYFDQGKLAGCSEFAAGALTLGDVLQQLGMATREKIDAAFAQQLRDVVGKRIGERLIAMRAIVPQQLQEALRTRALWMARELALWPDAQYEFVSAPHIQRLLPYGEAPLNIDIVRVTMEMVRYSDEWQEMKEFLPQGMHTMLAMARNIQKPVYLPARTATLTMHVNQYHKVRTIANAVHLPELEVARELAQLVRQRLLEYVPTSEAPPPDRHRVRLPNPAEKLRLENFNFFNCIIDMEQKWLKLSTPEEQLPTMVEFANSIMEALTETCQANNTVLDPNTLQTLLYNENLHYIGSYEFKIEQNHIDVESFALLCEEILHSEKAKEFYDLASSALQRMLSCIFEAINARVASPRERAENQDIWETLLEQFALRRLSP